MFAHKCAASKKRHNTVCISVAFKARNKSWEIHTLSSRAAAFCYDRIKNTFIFFKGKNKVSFITVKKKKKKDNSFYFAIRTETSGIGSDAEK